MLARSKRNGDDRFPIAALLIRRCWRVCRATGDHTRFEASGEWIMLNTE
jgi:hypothetical protein